MSVSCPKERRDEVPTLAVKDQEWMVHVLLVVAMVVATFLIAMGGVVGGIEVQKDFLRSAILAPLCEVDLEEDFGYPVARASRGGVLKPADGRLLARSAPLSGKEPHTTLSKGSSRRESESFWSS